MAYVYVGIVCSLSTFSDISSETTGRIEAKFHMKFPLGVGTNVCLGNLGQKPFKNLLLQNQWADCNETLGMQHWGLGATISCSNYNPGLTLTYVMPRSNFVS